MSSVYEMIYSGRCRSTHHKLALDAVLLLRSGESWKNLFYKFHEAYLTGAKAPDTQFKDFKNHVLHVKDNYWGGAIRTALVWYQHTIKALQSRDWQNAVYCAGVLSHYVTDPFMPLHTGQTESEGAVHRALEWSVTKSYESLRNLLLQRRGYPSFELPASTDWLEQTIRMGAESANQHYDILIDHYNLEQGMRNPPMGLDEELRTRLSQLLGSAAVAWSRILERVLADSQVFPPDVSPSAQSFLAGLNTPLNWINKNVEDQNAQNQIRGIVEEYQQTGKVIYHLPEDERAVRQMHALEVLQIPLAQLDAMPARRVGTQFGQSIAGTNQSTVSTTNQANTYPTATVQNQTPYPTQAYGNGFGYAPSNPQPVNNGQICQICNGQNRIGQNNPGLTSTYVNGTAGSTLSQSLLASVPEMQPINSAPRPSVPMPSLMPLSSFGTLGNFSRSTHNSALNSMHTALLNPIGETSSVPDPLDSFNKTKHGIPNLSLGLLPKVTENPAILPLVKNKTDLKNKKIKEKPKELKRLGALEIPEYIIAPATKVWNHSPVSRSPWHWTETVHQTNYNKEMHDPDLIDSLHPIGAVLGIPIHVKPKPENPNTDRRHGEDPDPGDRNRPSDRNHHSNSQGQNHLDRDRDRDNDRDRDDRDSDRNHHSNSQGQNHLDRDRDRDNDRDRDDRDSDRNHHSNSQGQNHLDRDRDRDNDRDRDDRDSDRNHHSNSQGQNHSDRDRDRDNERDRDDRDSDRHHHSNSQSQNHTDRDRDRDNDRDDRDSDRNHSHSQGNRDRDNNRDRDFEPEDREDQREIEERESKPRNRDDDYRFWLSMGDPLVNAPSIGKKTAKRFTDMGVETVGEFLLVDPEAAAELIKVRHITSHVIRNWQRQARLGCQLPEVRGHDVQILVGADLDSPEEIARLSPENLLDQIKPYLESTEGERVLRSNRRPDFEEVSDWIHWAKHARPLQAA